MNLGPEVLAWIASFGFVTIRLTGLALTLPVLLSEVAPRRVRALAIAVIAMALTSAIGPQAPESFTWLSGVQEFLIGAWLGLMVRVVMLAAEFGMSLAGVQMGHGFSAAVDPITHSQAEPLARLTTLVSALLFFALNGHHAALLGLRQSYRSLKPGASILDGDAAALLVERMGSMFGVGVRFAAPLLLSALGAQLMFGLLARMAPSLNVWAVGFVGSMAIGLCALVVFAPTYVTQLQEIIGDSLSFLLVEGWDA